MATVDPLLEPSGVTCRSLDGLDEGFECHYGLLTELKARRVVTERQIEEIKRPNSTLYEQNDKLIEFIKPLLPDSNKHKLFIASLEATGQSHVAKQISGSLNGNGDHNGAGDKEDSEGEDFEPNGDVDEDDNEDESGEKDVNDVGGAGETKEKSPADAVKNDSFARIASGHVISQSSNKFNLYGESTSRLRNPDSRLRTLTSLAQCQGRRLDAKKLQLEKEHREIMTRKNSIIAKTEKFSEKITVVRTPPLLGLRIPKEKCVDIKFPWRRYWYDNRPPVRTPAILPQSKFDFLVPRHLEERCSEERCAC